MKSDLDLLHALDVATELSKKAAARILELRNQDLEQKTKLDDSIVTVADFLSDKILCSGLLQTFPEHAILSEENTFAYVLNPDVDWTWVIDPLDGTKAYAKGIAGFCVMVGLLYRSEPWLGVVVDPLTNTIYQAIRGQGAFQVIGEVRKRLKVSIRERWKDMPIVLSPDFPKSRLDALAKAFQGPMIPPINSVGIKVGLLVEKQADLYLNHHPVHYWDTCAPQIILEEAGGCMTLWDGNPLKYDLESNWIHPSPPVASNGTRHREFVEKLSGL